MVKINYKQTIMRKPFDFSCIKYKTKNMHSKKSLKFTKN